mmetsp:Transcript_478/g.444  ORF Transcript_478/g.444 Transcript_478/m.444 type:complete len:116 (-) Transcript_478:1094-1441(-)
MLKKIIKRLCLIREKSRTDAMEADSSKDNSCTNITHIRLFLRFLKENDNTQNPFIDSNYLATLIGSLLQAKNDSVVKTILKEVLRYLQLERVLPSHENAVGLKILKQYNTFCQNH